MHGSRTAAPWALALGLCATMCGGEPVSETSPQPTPKVSATEEAPPPTVRHELHPSAAQALRKVLAETRPRAVGFGEFHQSEGTVAVRSALARFTDSLLPVMAEGTSDLVVETWVSEGGCGQREQAVVKDVETTTERPAATEDETVRLLKRAKGLGVQPHILEVECADYEKVLDGDGGVDYFELLGLIGRRLEDKGKKLLTARAGPSTTGAAAAPKMVALYGGAIHNDISPDEMFASFSFAAGLSAVAGGPYVEVDLYVPEFIAGHKQLSEESWYPLYEKLASEEQALLIKPAEGSYIIVFKKGVENIEPPSGTQGGEG